MLFFTVLISYLNSGLCKVSDIQSSKVIQEESFPYTQHISVIHYFLFTNIDVGSKNKLSPDRVIKFLRKIKLWCNTSNNELIAKYSDVNYSPLLNNPVLITRIFSPPDICFPFNYFW